MAPPPTALSGSATKPLLKRLLGLLPAALGAAQRDSQAAATLSTGEWELLSCASDSAGSSGGTCEAAGGSCGVVTDGYDVELAVW